MYITYQKETKELSLYGNLKAMTTHENLNWHTMRYHFARKKVMRYESKKYIVVRINEKITK